MKRIRIVLLVIAIFLLTTACSEELAYDKETAIDQTEQIVVYANNSDYQSIYDLLNENVKTQLAVETLRDAWAPIIASAGSFNDFGKATTQGIVQDDIRYIVVNQKSQYDEAVLNYTITFTEDMRIAALYMN